MRNGNDDLKSMKKRSVLVIIIALEIFINSFNVLAYQPPVIMEDNSESIGEWDSFQPSESQTNEFSDSDITFKSSDRKSFNVNVD